MRPFLLHHLLLASAARSPDALAIVDPKREATYAGLAERSAAAAAALAEAGVGPGDLVGIWVEKTPEAVGAIYGILRRGAAYVPIDPGAPPARAALLLRRVEARVAVTTADRVEILFDLVRRGELPDLHALAVLGPAEAPGAELRVFDVTDAARPTVPDARVTSGALAYVLHTSGSTGVPKGVAITHENALAFVEPAAEVFGVSAADRLACQAPLHFDLSVFDLFCAAARGATVVSIPAYMTAFPRKMASFVRDREVTVWNSVVSALALLVDKGLGEAGSLPALRAVAFSGERMPIPLLRRVRSRAPNAALYNVYGQTEANSSLIHRVEEVPADDGASLPLGEPLPNFDVFLVDESGAPIAEVEAEGELCVRAATVASGGYFRAPEPTKEKFILDPRMPDARATVYRTGDRVRRDAAGVLTFAGRRDNLIKTRGQRVELGEVEVALESIEGVAEVAVIAVPSEEIGHALHAFVCVAAGTRLDAATLDRALRERLPPYMVPESVELRADLPRTSTGKIDKKALAGERA